MTSPERNLASMFFNRVERYGALPRYRHKVQGQWQDVSWEQMGKRVRLAASGLLKIGVSLGDRVCLLSSSRPSWSEMDFAILSAGAITVPIYPSLPASDCGFILWNAGSRVIAVENAEQLAKVREIQKDGIIIPDGMELPTVDVGKPLSPGDHLQVKIERVILLDGEGDGGADLISLEALMALGEEHMSSHAKELERILQEVQREDVATIVYTSGTTGPPKGVVQSHGNHLSMCEMVSDEVGIFQEGDVDFLFLPLAHSFARLQEFVGIYCGSTTAFAQSVDTLVTDLGEAAPQVVPAVPRVYEKIYSRVQAQARSSPMKKAVFDWAVGVGKKISVRRMNKQPIPAMLALQGKLAHRLVFHKLHALVGGKIKYFISGGAPLSREIAEFFHAAGLLILEGYGLTETCPALAINRPDNYRFGTVGPKLPWVEVKVAADGELIARGPNVTREYYHRPKATREAWDDEGWFHTGDIAEIDSDGFIRITDRKKELIVTAGGKNISPQNVENVLKTSPYVSQVLLYGDNQPYCVALVTLTEEVVQWARANGKQDVTLDQLARDPDVRQLIENEINERNAKLAKFETVKKFAIVHPDFTQETGELTPTLKLKRRVVLGRHRGEIDVLYGNQETN